MEISSKAKELNKIMIDTKLSVEEKQGFVDTLSEIEMRQIFKEMMSVWCSE